jgi:thiol-disulfide isomerase/thioredoxin
MRKVKTIEPQAFDVELRGGGVPLLVAFLKRNERFSDQVGVLEATCRRCGGSLRCFLYDEDYLDMATERFSVKGTPTFLLFHRGREVDRLIGESDGDTLNEFVGTSLAGLDRADGP